MRRPLTWLRVPVVHFLAGGALLFGVVHGRTPSVRPPGEPTVTPIVLTADDVARLRAEYARDTGLEPSDADEAALVEQAIEEEVLFREAITRGLDLHDRSVRNWLVQQMSVLAPERADDADALYARAQRLGLDRTDTVVRRILVRQVRLLAGRVGERPPTDAELRAFHARHADEYRPPDRLTFWHVFLSSDAWGVRTAGEAAVLADLLRRDARAPDAAVGLGDAFAVGPRVVGQSASQVAKVFGPAFASATATAALGEWVGPVRSPYGSHLVWVESREAGAAPSLAAVRSRLVERWKQEQRVLRVEAFVRELRGRYPIEVASAAWREGGRS